MKMSGFISVVWLLLAASVWAQMQPPKPAPETKKLDYFAGTWTLTGNLKPGSMGPGGTITENEKCEWMENNFYLVCHTDFQGSMGTGTGDSYLGYSNDEKMYTYREFNSWGEFEDSRGSIDGEKWTWTSDEKFGGMPMKGRFSMKIASPTSYDFSFDVSQDGAQWTTVMDGKATKDK
jgi:hypothetical protein